MKVIRLLKAYKIKQAFNRIQEILDITPSVNALFSILKLIALNVAIAHWIACFFHLIGTSDEYSNANNWLKQSQIYDETWQVRYVNSIYWAITTMITVGYGDIVPITYTEKIYTIFAMLLSSGLFGYTINRMGIIFSELSYKKDKIKYLFTSPPIAYIRLEGSKC